MELQRPTTSKSIKVTKSGMQKISLTGSRYVLVLKNGNVENFHLYSNSKIKSGEQDITRVQEICNDNEYLSTFTGILEVMMNSFEFKILDIMEHENVQNEVHQHRLEYLTNNLIDDISLVVPRDFVHSIETKVKTPTLYRSLDSSYNYGSDYIISPTSNESVFLIVGEYQDVKDVKIQIPKVGYENIAKVPKVVKQKFDNLEAVNNWVASLVKGETVTVSAKTGYIEFDHTETSKMYLVAGLCPIRNTYKVFGKLKPSSVKQHILVTKVDESVKFEWHLEKLNTVATDVKYYNTGYVIGCARPKVSLKSLATVSCLDIRQSVNLKNIPQTLKVDIIPTFVNQQARKKAKNLPTHVLAAELSERLMHNVHFRDIGIQLQNIEEQVNNSSEKRESSDSESDNDEPNAKKMRI